MIGFVILHYMAYDMTVECVKTLLTRTFGEPIQIAVVDNASPNGTGEALQENFKNFDNIHIILNKENLGFAKGNNIGFDFLKKNYSLDFMLIMNEDILIDDDDFIKKVRDIYGRTHFAVLGPDVYAPRQNEHQSPVYLHGNSKEAVQKMKSRLEKDLRHYTFCYYKNALLAPIKRKVKAILYLMNGKKSTLSFDKTKEYENPVLHGSCYIFSRDFIKARDYAFYPGTFLYWEEDILHMQCLKNALKMYYSPSITVRHMRNVSTDMAFKTKFKKERMEKEQLIKSMGCFLELCD